MDKAEKIKKYNLEEITYILLILATDLSNYSDENLIEFAEDIEGRIDLLFTYEFIITLKESISGSETVCDKIERLRSDVVKLYSSVWHKKLKTVSAELMIIRTLAKEIIEDLGFNYIEPLEYSENHLNIDW